jgi:hypothetical protein
VAEEVVADIKIHLQELQVLVDQAEEEMVLFLEHLMQALDQLIQEAVEEALDILTLLIILVVEVVEDLV